MIVLSIAVAPLLKGQTGKTANSAGGRYKFEEHGHSFDHAYVDRVLNNKTKQLQQYLTALVKKEGNTQALIKSAMALFNNDESRLVTVTSKTTGKVYVKPVRQYLDDVARLPYKSVTISYRNYSAIQNIRRQPDGLYKGVVVFEQEFTGFDKEGKALYHDVVTRNVETVVRLAVYPKGQDTHVVALDVFFGNMGVTEM